MVDVVVCAENPIARAGLTAMVAAASHRAIAQLSSLQSLSFWLQSQSGVDGAELIVVECAELGDPELTDLLQLTDDPFGEETVPVLIMLDNWDELNLATVCSLSAESAPVSLLPMTVSADQFSDAIAAILNGLVVFHPDISAVSFAENNRYSATSKYAADALLEPLTPREIQVLNQLANGLTNREIAKTLNISEHTVKFHIGAIFSKLTVSSRTAAVAMGVRHGLVML